MDERRLFAFMWTAIAIVIAYSFLQLWLFGPPAARGPQPVKVPDRGNRVEPPEDLAAVEDSDAESEVDEQITDAAQATPLPATNQVLTASLPERRLTLGSLDPASGFAMLVTLNSRGAALERIELNDRRYRELERHNGYLGQLELRDHPEGGCEVLIVGAGTPAARAVCPQTPDIGLRGRSYEPQPDGSVVEQAGDCILAVDGKPVDSTAGLRRRLLRTRPGQTVTLTVRRIAPGGAAQQLEFTTELIDHPLQLIRPESETNPEFGSDEGSFLLTFFQLGNQKIQLGKDDLSDFPSLRKRIWDARYLTDDQGVPTAVEFFTLLPPELLRKFDLTGPCQLLKRYRLNRRADNAGTKADSAVAYGLDFEVEIRNLGEAPLTLAYQLDGPNGLTDEGWWYSYKIHPRQFGVAGARDIVLRPHGRRHEMIMCSPITKHAVANPKVPHKPLISSELLPLRLDYIGCDAQYFAVALLPASARESPQGPLSAEIFAYQNAVARIVGSPDEKLMKRSNVSFRLMSERITIPAGESQQYRFKIFAGPKDPEVLQVYGLQELIVYGWFKIFAKPMIYLLHVLYWLSGGVSYGVAILLLTVLVRGAMFPFGRQMALNAQKMQELAPEMKRIAEKYKDDLAKRSEAQQELFRKHNYNPLSGCLVMFFQLPVFVGLYRALSVDLELRQASLLPGMRWCSNLAGPDQLFDWSNILPSFLSDPAGWLGPYFNLLPIFSTVLLFVQQKMFTPPPQDEQQKMQQQIMTFMMIFMGVLLYKIASGLCIYFIASSLWGLAERKLLPKSKGPTSGTTSVAMTERPSELDSRPSSRSATDGATSKKARKKGRR